MRQKLTIWFVLCMLGLSWKSMAQAQHYAFDFYEGTFQFHLKPEAVVLPNQHSSAAEVFDFYEKVSLQPFDDLIYSLKTYQKQHELNDWIYYQLIRKTADQICPKSQNYFGYTLYKWFLMGKCGYDVRLATGNGQVIFYVRNAEDIRDIPYFEIDNKKYTCLNYHDYGKQFKQAYAYKPINLFIPEAEHAFSYKVAKIPDFKPDTYIDKDLQFRYRQKVYHFKLRLNPEIQSIFKNYPGVDFETYFNIPLSRETYSSLIPVLKENLKNMGQKKGIDYLMRFTRYAFLYENDDQNFGEEKHLSPEQTLLSEYSDCDDRAALFFYLVKEIYNVPMIAILYPTHLTMAVQFDRPEGKFIEYRGKKYSYCEPTPQAENLKIGQISNHLKLIPYEIVYAYDPKR